MSVPDVEKPVAHGEVDCNPALERFLPGEYDFCLSVRDYQHGKYRSGLAWAQLAAGWGQKAAQFGLGIAYFNGQDVPANRPEGAAWLKLAAECGDNSYYQAVLASALASLSPAENQQSTAWYERLAPKYADQYAATRAAQHFNREMKSVREAAWSPTSSEIYIAGLDATTPLAMDRQLEDLGARYFQGWGTHVVVGKLLQVDPATAGSTAR
ncbi:hypothetical protein ACYJW8_05750 [Frateuria aurantia]